MVGLMKMVLFGQCCFGSHAFIFHEVPLGQLQILTCLVTVFNVIISMFLY